MSNVIVTETRYIVKVEDNITKVITGGISNLPGPQGTPGVGIPVGGTASQSIIKLSNIDFDAEWGTPVIAHSALTGLTNDDHPQYHDDIRGDVRYYTKSSTDTLLGIKSDTGHTHLESDITDLQQYSLTTHDHNTTYEPIFTKQTGFNLDLGTTASTISAGDHSHTGVYATSVHTHVEADITDLQSYLLNITAESLNELSNVYTPMVPNAGDVLTFDITNGWQSQASVSGVTDHLLLTNIGTNSHTQIDTHIADTTNPHSVTKAQVGLGSVDDTTDLAKPISTATQTALDLKSATTHTHTGVYEPVFTKNSAFNLNFGALVGTICEGNDARLSDARTPTAHTHVEADITDFGSYLSDITLESIGSLVNVTTTSTAGNDLLQWSGTQWVNRSLTGAGIADRLHTHVEADITDFGSYSLSTHDHDATYEPIFTKNTAFNLNLGTLVGTVSEGDHTHTGVYEPSFAKNNGFNLVLGTAIGQVAKGDHNHSSAYEPINVNIQAHIVDTTNPHNVTKAQVGLGSVDDTTDLAKPISTATQTALDLKSATTHTHVKANITDFVEGDYATAAQGTLADLATQPGDNISTLVNDSGFIANVANESINSLLDVYTTMVPSTGDVLTYDLTNGWQSETPVSGVTDHLLLTNIGTNSHTQIDTHIADTTNPHSVTKAQVGLGSVDDTTDLAKPISTATQTALDLKSATTHTHTGVYEPVFTKNSAFNLNFGALVGTICEGNDARLSDARTPTAHTHVEADITDLQAYITGITSESIKSLSDVSATMVPNAGDVLTFDAVNGWQSAVPSGGGSSPDYIHLQHKVAYNVAGGTLAAIHTWETRGITVEISDLGGNCTLSANEFTLLAGTYEFSSWCVLYGGAGKLTGVRLWDVTNAIVLLQGTTLDPTYPNADHSINGLFVLAATTTLRMEVISEGVLVNGLGGPTNNATYGDNVYADIVMHKTA